MTNNFQMQALAALREFEELLTRIAEKPSEKRIHAIRVVIKKLRAYQALLEPGQPFKASFKAITRLNKLAQKLRDKQVMQKALRTLPAWQQGSKADNMLCDTIAAMQQDVMLLLHKKKFRKQLQADVDQMQQMTGHAAAKTLKQSFAVQHKHHPLDPDSADWHDLRKKWKKEWFEIQALYGEHVPVFLTKTHFPGQKLPHQLGNWHDWLLISQYIEEMKPNLKKGDYYLLRQQAQHKLSLWESRIKPGLQAIQP